MLLQVSLTLTLRKIRWIERKKNPSTDPIQYHRDKIQEQKNLELEFEKLKGDLRCLEAECDKSIEIIDNELDTIEQVEYTINPEYLKPLDVEKIQEVKQELENNKQEVIKTKISINKYKDNFKPIGTIKEISTLEFRINEIKEFVRTVSEVVYKLNPISRARKPVMTKLINLFKKSEPDAVELWHISVYKDFENNPYIKTNGKVIESIDKIENSNLQEFVTKKVRKQLGSIHNKGDLHAKIIDTYDFNKEPITHFLVYNARILQEHMELETYYTITNIIIPSKIWKQY